MSGGSFTEEGERYAALKRLAGFTNFKPNCLKDIKRRPKVAKIRD